MRKIVYRHRRKDNNNIFYIGIGNEKRAYSKNGRNKYWNNIVNKTDYIVEILAKDLSWEDACELEVFLISQYGRENLTNLTDGGDGNVNPDKETRYKIGSANRGVKWSDEKRLKMNSVEKFKKHKDESKLNISLNHKKSKRVLCLETGVEFISLLKACECFSLTYKKEWQRLKKNKSKRFIYTV